LGGGGGGLGKELSLVSEHLAQRYNLEGRRFDSRLFHWNFSLTFFIRQHYGAGVKRGSNRMSTKNIFWGVKKTGAWSSLTYQLQLQFVLKYWDLRFPETSGPVQKSTGID